MFENGLDIHHDMVENIIKKMEQLDKVKHGNFKDIPSDYSYDYLHVIRINEFFRNDLMILILGYSFALILFITEILFLYLNQSW